MAIRTAWRSLPGRDPVAAPARAPEAPRFERLIADTLAALAHGGWVADLGMLWAAARFPDVTRALDAARGVLWVLETAA